MNGPAVGVGSMADAAEKVTQYSLPFHFEREYVNGFFSNLTLLSALMMSVRDGKMPFESNNTFLDEYDYVIVGGGSAGNVIASRLTENPCIKVLLLEAGRFPPLLTEVPAFARLFYNTDIDWAYKSTPQKHSGFAQKENRIMLTSGKALGGTGELNAMLYVRGNRKNFDDWAAEGATGWSYEDVLPYFLKLEDNRDIDELDPGFHNVGGPVTAEKINYVPEIKKPILEAFADMGFGTVDINGEKQTGIYDIQAFVRNQQRCSSLKSHLLPAILRPNLDILLYAFARKILFSEEKVNGEPRATGVEFDLLGVTNTVRARREVILSNGALGTPQLLMLSGIGPKEHLEEFGIDVIADLPVGKNLQDHSATNLVYTLKDTVVPYIAKAALPTTINDYIFRRKGPLTAPNQCTVLAFLDTLNKTKNAEDFPMQEVYFAEYTTIDARLNFNLKDEVFQKVYAPYVRNPVYICFASLLQPYSRGEVTLNSLDPHDHPNINPNYHEDERDVEQIVEGMKICQAVANHPAMQRVGAKLIETQASGFPGCEEAEGDEDRYFSCLARSVVNVFWHFVGTARMGSRDDPRSVVDPELRVIGVRDLRVISAAVMPIVTSGNTNVPTMMVAEKAYDMMKGDINCSKEEETA